MANEKMIDGNALFAKFERIAQKSGVPHFHLDEIADEINEADAVEVVRCKDCRHWQERWKGKYSDEWHGYCDLDDEPVGRWGCDFCSYGERREGE